MNPGDLLFQLLGPLVNGAVYRINFPQELISPPGTGVTGQPNRPTWPAIRIQEISAFNAPDIMGSGFENTDDKEYQIDVVGEHRGTMRVLVGQVIAALQDTYPPCTRSFQSEDFDSETKTYRGILRYTFFSSTPAGSP